MEQSDVKLRDQIDWRIRMLHYGLRYLDIEEGAMQPAQVQSDLEMLTLEIRAIVEGRPGPVQTSANGVG